MVTLKEALPPAKSMGSTYYDRTNEPWFKKRFGSSEAKQDRKGFVLQKAEDSDDWGAFYEIHIAQYPLGMAREKSAKTEPKTLALTVDPHGNLAYDATMKQNENSKKIVYSQYKDIIPKILKNEEKHSEIEDGELQRQIEETTKETKAALEKIVSVRLSVLQPKTVLNQSSDSKYVKHKPSQWLSAFNSGARERIARVVEMPVDPLEPPKFKHKRVPRASGSPPVTVMHSPPRPVTVKDQQAWKIPPCISSWKNPKGYTIPLDKLLTADGRGLQDVRVNDNFAKLSEALYVGEQKSRAELAMRLKVEKEMKMKENERKERELRALAQKARSEREKCHPGETRDEREELLQRKEIQEERRFERERERRFNAKDAAMGKKRKITRERDRDISEKVALGLASEGNRGGEVLYDQRLFNQEKGMNSGFAADDRYDVYDKGLFAARPTLSTLYKPKKDADADVLKTGRFRPGKAFKDEEEADPFGLDRFLTEVKRGKKEMTR